MVSQQNSSAQSASTQKLSSAPFLLILVAYNIPSFYDTGFTIVFSNKYRFSVGVSTFPRERVMSICMTLEAHCKNKKYFYKALICS